MSLTVQKVKSERTTCFKILQPKPVRAGFRTRTEPLELIRPGSVLGWRVKVRFGSQKSGLRLDRNESEVLLECPYRMQPTMSTYPFIDESNYDASSMNIHRRASRMGKLTFDDYAQARTHHLQT
jgi:hypothetical protein